MVWKSSSDAWQRVWKAFDYTGTTEDTVVSYSHNVDGLITADTTVDGGVTRTVNYQYDNLNRLLSEVGRNSSGAMIYANTYTYDRAGNRTRHRQYQAGVLDETWTMSYNAANQLTQRTNAAWDATADGGLKTLYSYDDNGNLTDADTTRLMEVNSSVSAFSDAQWDYQWNPRDQLTRASLYNPWSASSGYEVEYRYCLSCDGSLSERILRNPADQVVSWQRYEYDGLNLVRADERYDSDADGLDTADPWRVREVATHRPGQLAALMQKQVYTYTGASGVPSSTDVFTYAYDHIGNVFAVADSSGNREFAFTQDAFGNELDIASSPFDGDPWSTAAAVGITEHQTGKRLDPFTGLYYFHARWYDSEVGRFVSRDERRARGISVNSCASCSNKNNVPTSQWHRSVNRYLAYRNAPSTYTDTDGHQAVRPDCIKKGGQGDPTWNTSFPEDWWKAKFGNYCGEGTDLRLECEPVNDLDHCCRNHDFCYQKYGISPFDDHIDDDTKTGDRKACCDKNLCKCNDRVSVPGGGGSLSPEVNPGAWAPAGTPYMAYSNALRLFFQCTCNTIRRADGKSCPASTNPHDYPELYQ